MVAEEKFSFNRQRLKELRDAAKLSQVELANRAGLSPSIVAQLEQGYRVDPKMSTVVRLAKALGVSAEKLIAEE